MFRGSTTVANAGSRNSGFWFALPWLTGLCLLQILPMLASLALSFLHWDGVSAMSEAKWTGFAHYERLGGLNGQADDARFTTAVINTLYFALIAVPAGMVAGFAGALLLNVKMRGAGFYRTIFFLPNLLRGVSTILLWSWLFNPQFGAVNRGLRWVYGMLDPVVSVVSEGGTATWEVPNWLYSPESCKPALIMMHVWMSGGVTLVFLAALQRVPKSQLEAASIDGAGWWRRFLHVTIPHISPAILFNLVVGLIFAMQAFDMAYLLYNRSQEDGLLFVMLHLYRTAFEYPYAFGYASAMAWVWCVVIGLIVAPVLMIGRRLVYEEVRK